LIVRFRLDNSRLLVVLAVFILAADEGAAVLHGGDCACRNRVAVLEVGQRRLIEIAADALQACAKEEMIRATMVAIVEY